MHPVIPDPGKFSYCSKRMESGATLLSPLVDSELERSLEDRFVRIVPYQRGAFYIPDDDVFGTTIIAPGDQERIALVRSGGWNLLSTSFEHIDGALGVNQMISNSPCKAAPIKILDWGCGRGIGLSGLGESLKQQGVNHSLIGYSDEYYPQWQERTGDLTFVWDTCEGLQSYIESGSLDLIYSYQGLTNLLMYEPIDRVLDHLNSLKVLLREEARIVFDSGTYIDSWWREELQDCGFEFVMSNGRESTAEIIQYTHIQRV